MPHTLPDNIRFLLDPAAYPHKADDVHLVQTHISYVFIAGEYVYKLKKEVDFGFLDFSSLAKRKYYCEQELVLNRRLCPDIYLDVVTINKNDTFSLQGKGEVVEYGIKMKRMPEDRMMVRLMREGKVTESHIDAIVAVLEPFYEKAESGKAVEKFGRARAVGENVLENLAQARPFVGCNALSAEEYEAVEGYSREFLAKSEIFDRRIASGRIKDCHGDLHSANICLADKVYIYDCIEFNERFRFGDVANDIAFLAMDLDFYNRKDLSAYFIDRFISDTGDDGVRDVLNFYKCYRAAVRGKVGLMTAHEDEVDDETKAAALDLAEKYFFLAQEYARSKT